MTDDAASLAAILEHVSPERRVSLGAAAELAVLMINAAAGQRFSQPALTPTDAAVWQHALGTEAGARILRLWNSLEEATPDEDPALTRLRMAGGYLFHAILYQVIAQGQVGLDYLRQFATPPPAPTPASPAPGASA
jgi:hypothetical protein